MNYPFRYGVNSLLLNNLGRTFLDSEFILGVEPRKDEKTMKPWFDVDCFGQTRTTRIVWDKKENSPSWGRWLRDLQ